MNFLRAFVAWRLALLWTLMVLYVAMEVHVLNLVGLWDQSHLKDTFVWTIGVALVLFIQVATKDSKSFREAALANFNASVAIDFFANLYVFGLLVELFLLPLLLLLVAMQAISQARKEFKSVERLFTSTLAVFGGGVLVYSFYSIYSNWSSFARIETAKDFLVPLALSLLFMPFIYLGMLYLSYERFLARLQFYVKEPRLRARFRWRALLRCHLSATLLEDCAIRLRGNQINSEIDMLAFFGGHGEVAICPPEGYRSMKWGDPPSDGLRQFSATDTDELTLYKPTEYQSFLGLPVAEELYGFTHDRLYQGTVWFDGEERSREARVRISSLYGPPSFANEYRDLWKWKWEGSQIEIHLWFERKHDRTSVLFINNAI